MYYVYNFLQHLIQKTNKPFPLSLASNTFLPRHGNSIHFVKSNTTKTFTDPIVKARISSVFTSAGQCLLYFNETVRSRSPGLPNRSRYSGFLWSISSGSYFVTYGVHAQRDGVDIYTMEQKVFVMVEVTE